MTAFWGASVMASDSAAVLASELTTVMASDLAAVLASELTTVLASDLAIFLKGKAGWRMLLLLVPFVPAETENYKARFLSLGHLSPRGFAKISRGTQKLQSMQIIA